MAWAARKYATPLERCLPGHTRVLLSAFQRVRQVMSRIRIATLDEELLGEVRYLNASRGGKTEVVRLPIMRAWTEAPLADELDAIVACSDLQGIVRGRNDESTLLGVHVAEILEEMAFDGAIPASARMGAILAGDLYSVPGANKRGGYGDVADVWAAFAERFAWVAGVAGNHDDVDAVAGANVHLLDGALAELDGLRIGGVGGIISEKQRPWRRPEGEQLRLVDRVIDEGVDLLILHEGPDGDSEQYGVARDARGRRRAVHRLRPLPLGRAARRVRRRSGAQRRRARRRDHCARSREAVT